jgi:hypothetical protein
VPRSLSLCGVTSLRFALTRNVEVGAVELCEGAANATHITAPAGSISKYGQRASAMCRQEKLARQWIAKAKAAGVYKVRRASIDVNQVRKMKADGIGPGDIAKALNRPSVYRVLAGASPAPQ